MVNFGDREDELEIIEARLELCGEQIEYVTEEMENIERIERINPNAFNVEYYDYLSKRLDKLGQRLIMLKQLYADLYDGEMDNNI